MKKALSHLILAITTPWTSRGHPLTRMVAGVQRPLSRTLLYINRDLDRYVYMCVQVDKIYPEGFPSLVLPEFDRPLGQHPTQPA